jgi:hypothetical protein
MKAFTNQRLNRHLPLLICILLFPLTMFLTGCYSTRMEIVMDEKIPNRLSGQAEKDIEIISLKLKSGSIISLEDKDAKFLLDYKGMKNVIYYTSSDTIKLNGEISKVAYKDSVFQLNDIKYIKIETSELKVGAVVAITVVVLMISTMVGLFIGFEISK